MDESRAATPQEPPQAKPLSPPTPLSQIRTFQGDVARALSEQNESLYSIQHKEAARRDGASDTPEVAPSSSKGFYFLAGLLLFLIAGAGAWYTYNAYIKKTAPPVISMPQSRFISAESSSAFDISSLSREEIFQAITDTSDGTQSNELIHIVVRNSTSTEATITQFLDRLESSAPGSLVRAFQPTFMLGSLGQSRFIILKLASYENAFGGMLNWELNLPFDLAGLFVESEALKSIGPDNVFKDIVSRNKDVRALLPGEETGLVYSFLGQDFLIITDKLDTLSTLIDRLTRETLTR